MSSLPAMMVRALAGLFVVVSLVLHAPANAQEAPLAEPGTVLAPFGDAQALAVDPRGRLYVADAARDVVRVLTPDGTPQMVLGGSGTRAGEFDTPTDVDPTNGQLILVADTYNGRLQRFSEEGQYLESLPIGATDRAPGGTWRFDDGRGAAPVRADGRPIAVARDDEGAIFVLDRSVPALLKWTELGQGERIAGGRRGRLREPVALAVGDGRRVYVADAEQQSVLVYDTFGTFRRRVPVEPLPTVRALTVHRGRLYIVCAERVLVWDRSTGRVVEHEVQLSESLVDVSRVGEKVYLLTPTRLLEREGW